MAGDRLDSRATPTTGPRGLGGAGPAASSAVFQGASGRRLSPPLPTKGEWIERGSFPGRPAAPASCGGDVPGTSAPETAPGPGGNPTARIWRAIVRTAGTDPAGSTNVRETDTTIGPGTISPGC